MATIGSSYVRTTAASTPQDFEETGFLPSPGAGMVRDGRAGQCGLRPHPNLVVRGTSLIDGMIRQKFGRSLILTTPQQSSVFSQRDFELSIWLARSV